MHRSASLLAALALSLTSLLAVSAAPPALAAEENPPCPTGEMMGWQYMYNENSLRLEKPDAPITWQLEDDRTLNARGYAVSYYWSEWRNPSYPVMKDRMHALQVGLFVRPPEIDGFSEEPMFSTREGAKAHSYYQSLSGSDGLDIPLRRQTASRWRPDIYRSVLVATNNPEQGEPLKALFEEGGEVSVSLYSPQVRDPERIASATVQIDSISEAFSKVRLSQDIYAWQAEFNGLKCTKPNF